MQAGQGRGHDLKRAVASKGRYQTEAEAEPDSPEASHLERRNRRLGREVARQQMRALAAEARLAHAADVEAACARISEARPTSPSLSF